jgi:hypothetical protein
MEAFDIYRVLNYYCFATVQISDMSTDVINVRWDLHLF